MLRATPVKEQEIDVLMALQDKNLSEDEKTEREILEYRRENFGKWLRVAWENDKVFGYISARPVDIKPEEGISDVMFSDLDMPEGDTMAILNVVTDKDLENMPCSPYMENDYENFRDEVFVLLLRVLIIESRVIGEFERVLITVKENQEEYFSELGFHELGPSKVTVIESDEKLIDMEYFLNSCQGNCSFCKAC